MRKSSRRWWSLAALCASVACSGTHLTSESEGSAGMGGDPTGGEGARGGGDDAGAGGDDAGMGGRDDAGGGGDDAGIGGEGGANGEEPGPIYGTLPDIPPIEWEAPGPSEAIVFARGVFPDELWIARTDGSEQHHLFEGTEPSLSPDGTRLAFVLGGSLWIADADGSDRHAITPEGSDDRAPCWSPDGQSLVFVREGSLYRVSLDSLAVVPILPDGVSGSEPDWHGSKIVYSNGGRIWLKDAADSAPGVELGYGSSPSFSPDGTRIVVVRYIDEINIMDLDGSNPRTLVDYDYLAGDCWVASPFWASDGDSVLLTSECEDFSLDFVVIGRVDADTEDPVDPWALDTVLDDEASQGDWGNYAP